MSLKDAYRVDVDDTHRCTKHKGCPYGRRYDIIDFNGIALGESYDHKEKAEDICDELNRAYRLGYDHGRSEMA